jgi:glycosyltransferase involved in cell wall biosynthesis
MNRQLRYLYVKNGDVVEQLETLQAMRGRGPDGGPDAFLADFLTLIGSAPLLLLSTRPTPRKIVLRNVEARVFPSRIENIGPCGRVAALIYMFVASLCKAIRYKPQRVVCGTTGVLLWTSWLAARVHRCPFIHSRHNSLGLSAASYRRRFLAAIDGFFIRRADAVICHGPYLRDQLKDLGVKKELIFEFDSGLRDLVEEARTRKETGTKESAGAKTILYVGRMETDKGILDLLRACAKRMSQDRSLRLVYAGQGQALGDLRKEVERLDIAEQVSFLGKVSRSQVGALIAGALLIAIPTRTRFPEGRCMAAMEGLALSVPVIAPNFGPFPYLIEHGQNGLLFQPDSVSDLRRKILSVIDDENLHRKLSRGAKESGERLLDPPLRFAEAARLAFEAKTAGRKNHPA